MAYNIESVFNKKNYVYIFFYFCESYFKFSYFSGKPCVYVKKYIIIE